MFNVKIISTDAPGDAAGKGVATFILTKEERERVEGDMQKDDPPFLSFITAQAEWWMIRKSTIRKIHITETQ